MNYQELAERIDAGLSKAGDTFYITDFRHDDILYKPIRNIAPTEVELFSNDDLPKGKTIYYAEYHFREIGKTGKVLAKVIAPYDNTGFRGYTGVSVNIFKTMEEAKAHYVTQCEAVIRQVEEAKAQANIRFDGISDAVNQAIRDNA